MAFMNYIVALMYEKNSLHSIFKWLVVWKRGLLKPKYSFENLFPSPTLSYTITKKPKRVFCSTKVIQVPEAPESLHWYGSEVS